MQVILNGKEIELPELMTVQDLLTQYHLKSEQIVVEINLEIIDKKEFVRRQVQNGDKIEFITFMGGG